MQTVSSLQQRHSLAQLLGALVLAYAAAASGQQPTSNGYISPPYNLPKFNPAAWDQAYKLLLRNVPAQYSSREVLHSLTSPNTLLSTVEMPQDCASEGFDSAAAAAVALGSCFQCRNPAGTTDYWVKLPGLALVNGNCYCYALDMFQGGYCYPGTKNGAIYKYRQKMTCKALSDGILSDGGKAVPRETAISGQPFSGHYIALMARPESCIKGHCYEADFHVLRKDSSGTWSWKHPGMPATNRDLFGVLVTDPEAAALQGSYQLCGYFRVEPQKMLHVDAGSLKEPGPLPVNAALDKFKSIPGVTIEISQIPYNPSTDTAISKISQEVLEEDTAWERLRGSEQYAAWRIREKQALELLPQGVVNTMAAAAEGGSSVSRGSSRGSDAPKRVTRHRRLFGAAYS